jgi:hypothetical protein
MTPAEQYRALASKLKAKAANERDEILASEWMQLARSYLRLAEQADQNTLATSGSRSAQSFRSTTEQRELIHAGSAS